jgi:hypothetical protein
MAELWLSGPIAGVDPALVPPVHALRQTADDIVPAIAGLTVEQLWLRPGGAASIGFHLQHIAGSLERLLTYARGEQLSREQIARARAEGEPGNPRRGADTMREIALDGIAAAIDRIKALQPGVLAELREVGRARLPATVIDIAYHCGEHSQRHAGQIVTTAKFVRSDGN